MALEDSTGKYNLRKRAAPSSPFTSINSKAGRRVEKKRRRQNQAAQSAPINLESDDSPLTDTELIDQHKYESVWLLSTRG